MAIDPPKKPSDKRNGEPFYINSNCDECGEELVLFDEDSGWYDEWECPNCKDGIYMDWPDKEMEKLTDRVDQYKND